MCHFQAVLREPQVKISKHLAALRAAGFVEAKRSGQWMCYALPAKADPTRDALFAALAVCAEDEPVFGKDAGRLAGLDLGCTPAADARRCC